VKNPLLPLLALLLAACGAKDPPAEAPPAAVTAPDRTSPLLADDIPGALGVLEAKEATVGEEVAVYGRVRKAASGVFTLVDAEAVSYCGEGDAAMDDCETPWDYCCENQDAVTAATLVVEAQDAAGGAVSKEDLGIRPLDLVAVRGTLTKDSEGILVLVAKEGWYRRERPEVEDNVKFE
jgi:hypothetical protein